MVLCYTGFDPLGVMDPFENMMKTLEPFPRYTKFCSPNQKNPPQDNPGTYSNYGGLELNILSILLFLCPSCTADTGKLKHNSPFLSWGEGARI